MTTKTTTCLGHSQFQACEQVSATETPIPTPSSRTLPCIALPILMLAVQLTKPRYLPEDLKNLGHPEGQALYAEHASANIKSNVCFYESIQRFEGQLPKSGNHGKVMISVKMQPRDGGDEEFDEWYRKQHLDMLSMVKGYRRSTRWKVSELREAPEGTPMYIALHEYDDVPDPEEVKLAVGTEWSKKVIGEARSFVRDQWELIEVQGEDEKL